MDLIRSICQISCVFALTTFVGLHSFLETDVYIQSGTSPTVSALMICALKAFTLGSALAIFVSVWVLKQKYSSWKNALTIAGSVLGTIAPVGIFVGLFDFWIDPLRGM